MTPRHFAWQAWHLVTSTFVLRAVAFALRGRRGTWRHPPSFHVAGVALGDIHLRFARQAWHLWHCVARLDSLVAGDAAALCAAGVALMALGGLWCHTPSLLHTIFHTPLCHTPSFTHRLWHTLFQDSLTHHLCHTPSFTHPFSHATLSHTIFDTPSFTHHFVTHHV